MEQKTRLRFFRSGDVAGLEEELNTRSAEGWQALRPGRFFQRYARGEGVFVHRIGGCLARRGSAEDITASAARQRAGWEEVCRRDKWLLFRKKAAEAAPEEALPEGREEVCKLLSAMLARTETLRRWMLILAALLLIGGYVSGFRYVMLGAVLPLAVMIPLTYRIKHLEEGMKK